MFLSVSRNLLAIRKGDYQVMQNVEIARGEYVKLYCTYYFKNLHTFLFMRDNLSDKN